MMAWGKEDARWVTLYGVECLDSSWSDKNLYRHQKHDGACLGNTGGRNGNKSNTQKRVGIRALSMVTRTTARGNDTER